MCTSCMLPSTPETGLSPVMQQPFHNMHSVLSYSAFPPVQPVLGSFFSHTQLHNHPNASLLDVVPLVGALPSELHELSPGLVCLFSNKP